MKRPEDDDAANGAPDDRPAAPLGYELRPKRRGWRDRASRFLARLSQPIPLGMYYAITFVLSITALVLAVIIRLIVRAFE